MRVYSLLLFVLLYSMAHGQLESRNWFLNDNRIAITPSGVTTGLPYPPNNFPVSYKSASVSDAAGNLLLAFNGNKIIDRNLDVMPAMTNVNLFAGDNKIMIQQVPNTNRYYVFYARRNNSTPNIVNTSWTLKYALVDLSLNSGNGDVVVYDQVIDTSCSPAFTLAQGDDPNKAWLITHRWTTDSFFVYPITAAGLSATSVASRAGTNTTLSDYIFRDLKTSYDGKMFAGIAYHDYTQNFATTFGLVEVFNFNTISGAVTAKVRTRRLFGYFVSYFSLEFSPDNRLLYESRATRVPNLQPCGFGSSLLKQYNLCYTDSVEFEKLAVTVATDFRFCNPNVTWGNIQTGADKRIHMPYSGNIVSTVNNPNRIGSYSNFLFNSYTVPNHNSGSVATPDFHHKLMEKAIKNNIVYNGGCYPDPTVFRITNDTITNVQWNFGDPFSASNTSTAVSPSHLFSAPGIFTVTAQLYNSQGTLIETVTELVEIKDPGKRILFDYPTDTSFCAGGFINIHLQVVNGLYQWYQLASDGTEINSTVSDSIRIDGTGKWYVKMRQNDCNGCTMLDSINVTVLPKPSFNLGTDRNLCQGDSLFVGAFDPAASYIWNTGATSMNMWIHQGGLYWLEGEYNNNGCAFRDSVLITDVLGISFALPGDTVLCNNQNLLLSPGVPSAFYFWQNGSTQQQFTVTQPGTYWVQVQSLNGCTKSDTIHVSYLNAQQVYLGNDTVLCNGSTLQLQANVNNAQYQWNTGATTQQITVSQAGMYWVEVDNAVCTVTDTITVMFSAPPVIFLGNDTTLCPQQQLLLNPSIAAAQYIWQDGSQAASYAITQAGIYWVEVRRNGCTVRDTINVQYHTVPAISAGPDVRFCTGDSITVHAGNAFPGYAWSNGSTTSSTVLHTAGTYWVTGTTINNCKATDTLQVLPLYPLPVINLGPDTDICTGTTKQLDAGSGFSSYSWNNGNTSSTITVSNAGIYAVVVRDQQGCRGSDSIQIVSLLPLPKNFLPVDTAICSYGSLVLSSLQNFNSYLWSTNSTAPAITITQPGVYWLEVKNNQQCAGRDSIIVLLKECMQGLYVPTAFTPNNDGRNDLFMPLLFGNILQYRFTVYNRWGQVLFTSAVPAKGWDGRFAGKEQDSNVFTWICRYQLSGQPVKTEKGTVMLIR